MALYQIILEKRYWTILAENPADFVKLKYVPFNMSGIILLTLYWSYYTTYISSR